MTDHLFIVDMEEIETQQIADEGEAEKLRPIEILEDETEKDKMKRDLGGVEDGARDPEHNLRGDGCKGECGSKYKADLGRTDSGYRGYRVGADAANVEPALIPQPSFDTGAKSHTSSSPILRPLPFRSYPQSYTTPDNHPATSASILVPDPLNIPPKGYNTSYAFTQNHARTKISTVATSSLNKTPESSVSIPYYDYHSTSLQEPDSTVQTSIALASSSFVAAPSRKFQDRSRGFAEPHYVLQPSVIDQVKMVDRGQLGLKSVNVKKDDGGTKTTGEGEILAPRTFEGFGRKGRLR